MGSIISPSTVGRSAIRIAFPPLLLLVTGCATPDASDSSPANPTSKDTMLTVESADGTPIAYWRTGSGPSLLLVHGATADHTTTWRFVIDSLEQYFTVYAMDRRGRGGSGDGSSYDLQREAEDVAAVVDAIGGRVSVIGHSYGGLSAIEASRLTNNIERLVLYEGVPLNGGTLYDPAVVAKLDSLVEAGDVEGMLVSMFRDLVEMSEEEVETIRAVKDAWETRLRNAPTLPRELAGERGYVFVPDRFSSMSAKTLLLVGGNSPPREMENATGVAAALQDARVVVLPGVEHGAMYTAPEVFLEAVLTFLLE